MDNQQEEQCDSGPQSQPLDEDLEAVTFAGLSRSQRIHGLCSRVCSRPCRQRQGEGPVSERAEASER